MRLRSLTRHLGVALVAFVVATACGASSGGGTANCDAKSAKSAADCGGMDALVAAAKKEGTLNVIALPPDWANYGAVIDGFKAKYGLKVNSANPNGSSQEEVDAIKQLSGTDRAPDVVDVGMKVALKVALAGDPTKSNQALNGVILASVANGGSLDDVSKGVDFFHQLKLKGNYVPIIGTAATVKAGTTPVLFEWDYLSTSHGKDVATWKIFVPQNATIGGYYAQAINKDAPHPAAARLWEEYLYSNDGQNLWLKGGARPVRQAAMEKSGKIDATAAAALPKITGTPQFPTQDQQTKAGDYVGAHWSQATS